MTDIVDIHVTEAAPGSGAGAGVGAGTRERSVAVPPPPPAGRAGAAGKAILEATDAFPGQLPTLYTPGPVTTSRTVKQAMLVDLGSRDVRFQKVIADIRSGLLRAAGLSKEMGYETVLMQGSGTFAVESVVSSVIPKSGAKLLVVNNGQYGARLLRIAAYHGIPTAELKFGERDVATAEAVVAACAADASITHVAAVHHETTSGCVTPIDKIGPALHAHNPELTFLVDSMSGFGAYGLDLDDWHVHFAAASPNKCMEGMPGFAYVLCNRERLIASEGNARTYSLDLHDQWRAFEKAGTFRFTPPVQVLVAFRQALNEFFAEGGVPGRHARYSQNFITLRDGMAKLGFELVLDNGAQGVVIPTFFAPKDEAWDLPALCERMGERGISMYPFGKLTEVATFRVASIGRLFPRDMKNFVSIFQEEVTAMGVKLPATPEKGPRPSCCQVG